MIKETLNEDGFGKKILIMNMVRLVHRFLPKFSILTSLLPHSSPLSMFHKHTYSHVSQWQVPTNSIFCYTNCDMQQGGKTSPKEDDVVTRKNTSHHLIFRQG